MYWRGEGVKQDNATALSWFEKGAEWGNPASLNALGMMSADGSGGFEKDLVKARSYFSRAVSLNDPDALFNQAELSFSIFFNRKNWIKIILMP